VQGCIEDPGCEEFLDGNLCHPLDPNRAPGTCQYLPTFCPADGCYDQTCNPNTGQCERANTTRNILCEPDSGVSCQIPLAGCPTSTCLNITCALGSANPNCAIQSPYIPNNALPSDGFNLQFVDNPSTCQTATVIPGVTNSFACQEGVGPHYTATNCAETQPLGPPGPCEEYVQNPTTAEPYVEGTTNPNPPCCELRPKQCRASDFGLPEGTTGYTFTCEPTTGACVATPQ
jgi:hypothetical protein